MSTPFPIIAVPRPSSVPADVFFPSIIVKPNIVLQTLSIADLSPMQAAYILPTGYRLPTISETKLYLQKALDVISSGVMPGQRTVFNTTTYLVPLNPGETELPASSPPSQPPPGGTTQAPPSTGIAPLDALINILNAILEPLTTIAKTVSTAGAEFTTRLKNTAKDVGSLVTWVDQPRTWIRILLISGGWVVTLIGAAAFMLSFVSVQDVQHAGGKAAETAIKAVVNTVLAAGAAA